MDTELTELLGIDQPVVQAPIGSATCPELTAAVSNAGGLGHLAVTWRGLSETRRVVERTRELTDRPFAVNLVLDEATTQRPTAEHLDACLDAGARIVSLSFGDAAAHVDRIHDAGGTVFQTVGSAAEAEAAGVDAVGAQGWEAGGHVQSEVATMPLVPRVADAVDVPVVAAGGIADGRGIAAALALEADGAWLGTRFLATEEANAHRAYRERWPTPTRRRPPTPTSSRRGGPGPPTASSRTRRSSAFGRRANPRPATGRASRTSSRGRPRGTPSNGTTRR